MHIARRLYGVWILMLVSHVMLNGAFFGDRSAFAQEKTAAGDDAGDFQLAFADAQNAAYLPIQQFLMEFGSFDDLLMRLNETLKLPTDIMVTFQEGDKPLYRPETKDVIMNYELIAHIRELFTNAKYSESEEELQVAVLDAAEFVLYHEIAHALIDAFGVTVTGSEEDAVDELTAIMFSEFVQGRADIVLRAADVFQLDASSRTKPDFWKEHSFTMPRFSNLLCRVYGSQPDEYAQILEENRIDPARADRCPDEYRQQMQRWMPVLAPYLNK